MSATFGSDSLSSGTQAVRRKVARPCMYYQAPLSRPEWRLKGFNKWRAHLKKAFFPNYDTYGGTRETIQGAGALTKHQMKELKRR